MIIRNANEKDLAAILDIFNYEIVHTPFVYIYEPWTTEYIQNWFSEKKKHNLPLIVSEIDNVIVGYATYGKFRDREAYDTSIEYSVYIHRNHRRKGIAYKLVQELIQIAKNQGYKTMIGGLDAGNKSSYDFHERLGFEKVAHIKSVARKFDKWLDLIFFQLMLDDRITIKLAQTDEEISAVSRLFKEYTNWCKKNFVRSGLLKQDDPELNSFNQETLPGKYHSPNGFLLLAYLNNEPVGCMFMYKLNNDTCELKRFYINPTARGHGLAVQMLNAFCLEAKFMGSEKLRISSHNFMSKAIEIYIQYGFKLIPNYEQDPLQAGDINMELNLNTNDTSSH